MKACSHTPAEFKAEFQAAGNPIVSFDTKKKEYIGNFYREGHLYTLQELYTYDHDFNRDAQGIIIPLEIDDMQRNIGYLHLGTSKDTSQFACDCIRSWWVQHGRAAYPQATASLGLCDGGGSHNTHHSIFKEDLQKLVDELGIEIRIAHYPPYCSKYNPIERRLFPQVTRACQGVIFTSIALVKKLMEKTHTSKGLQVVVKIIEHVYQTGRKVAEDFKANMRIVFDTVLPRWNYRVLPNQTLCLIRIPKLLLSLHFLPLPCKTARGKKPHISPPTTASQIDNWQTGYDCIIGSGWVFNVNSSV